MSQKLIYEIRIDKNSNDYTFSEVIEWVKTLCEGQWRYYNRKNYVLFKFETLNDAFKFKLKWTYA